MLIGTFGIDSESSPQLPSTTTFRFLNQKKRKFRYFGPTRGLWCLIISKWKSVWTFEFSQLHSQFEYNSKGYVMLDHFKVKISPNIWIFTTDTRPVWVRHTRHPYPSCDENTSGIMPDFLPHSVNAKKHGFIGSCSCIWSVDQHLRQHPTLIAWLGSYRFLPKEHSRSVLSLFVLFSQVIQYSSNRPETRCSRGVLELGGSLNPLELPFRFRVRHVTGGQKIIWSLRGPTRQKK